MYSELFATFASDIIMLSAECSQGKETVALKFKGKLNIKTRIETLKNLINAARDAGYYLSSHQNYKSVLESQPDEKRHQYVIKPTPNESMRHEELINQHYIMET